MKTAPFNAIFKKYVLDKLDTIEGVSMLDGFLVHYANDLVNSTGGVSFPCVAAQPGADDVEQQSGAEKKSKMQRHVKLIGAVSTVDRSKVNEEINNLIYTVRSQLAVDEYDVADITDLDIGGAKYDLPEAGEAYAYFELNITIKYIEKWS